MALKKVAIITRTRNRPLLLPRAWRSVREQTLQDFSWVLVNDGGEQEPVNQVAEEAKECGIQVEVLHQSDCIGMEACSNLGIKAVDSEFVVIHDDDDTWEPTFLQHTVQFLDQNPQYGGVVCRSIKVDESISNTGALTTLKQSPLNPRLSSVDIGSMSVRNQYPPISFLFRRTCYEEVQGFDPTLPVLGDWDFNLRFLMKHDIGVITDPLANHHHRYAIGGHHEDYGNTVTFGIQKHIEWEAIYRNRKLREDIQHQQIGLGFVMLTGKQVQAVRDDLTVLEPFANAGRKAKALLKKLRLRRQP